MAYVHRTFFAQSGGLENTGLRETKIDPTAIPAVRSFSRRSPQILAILSAQLSERELCRGVKWRRERVWNPTLSICNVLILLLSLSAEIRTPSASPSNLSKSVFSYPWLTGEPLLIHPLIPQSARAAKSVGVAQPPALAPRSRFTNIQLGPLVGGRSVSQMPTARPTSSSWKTRA